MGLQIDLLSINGAAHLAKLPKATDVATMEELDGDGMVSLQVPLGTPGTDVLLAASEALVRVSLDGEPVAWGVLDGDGDDPTEGPGRTIEVTAPGTAVLLGDAIVHADLAGEAARSFTTASPGAIMRTLILEAQGRGALQGIVWAFTDTHDSAGQPWTQKWTGTYDVGVTVRAVLANLVEQRLVDFRMTGLTLELYAADTVLRRDRPDVILQPGWLTEAPRQRSRQGKVTHMLALGDGGRTAEAVSGEPGRRREGFAQIGGIPDQGTLQIATEATLAPLAKVQQGHTTSYLLDYPVGLVNHVSNPTMEVNAAGYAGTPMARSTEWAASGAASLRTTGTGTASSDAFASVEGDVGALRLGMAPGGTYTLSATGYAPGARVGAQHVNRARRLVVFVRPGASNYTELRSVQLPIGKPERISLTFTLPEDATEAFVRLYNGSDSTSDVVFWDQVQLVDGVEAEYLPPPTRRPRPWSGYRVGDNIRRGDLRLPTGELEPLRVRSMSVSLNDDGAQSVSLELNDVFLEAEVANKLRLDSLTNGSIVGRPSVQYGVDTTKPAPPASVQITSDVYGIGNGALMAQATVSWPAVITNHDGTPTTDVAGYEVQYNIGLSGFLADITRTSETYTSRDAIPLDWPLQARVRTVDREGNYSDWQVSELIRSARDRQPPPKTSKPIVTSQLGLITVGWDGKAYNGAAMPNDLAAVEVWQSANAGFTVGDMSSSMVEQIRPGGGEAAVRGTAYGVPLYFRLRPVDQSGNYGVASEEGTGSRQWVVNPDIFDGAVGTSKLADLVVTTAKIHDLAVNGAKIADLAVGDAKIIHMSATKIIAGKIEAELIMGTGEILAGNPVAARVSIRNVGLEAYSASNNRTFNLSTLTGAVTIGPDSGPQMKLSAYGNWWNGNMLQAMLKFTHPNPLVWGEGNLFAQYWTPGDGYNWAALRLQSPYPGGGDPYAQAAYVDVRNRSDGHSQVLIRANLIQTTTNSMLFTATDGNVVDFTLQYNVKNVFSFRGPNAYSIIDMAFGEGTYGTVQTIKAFSQAYAANATLRLQGAGLELRSVTAMETFQVVNAQQGFLWVGVTGKGGLRFGDAKVHLQDYYTDSWKILRAWSFETASDPRLKSSARKVKPGALQRLRQVEVQDYGVRGAKRGARRFRGVMADQMQEHVPEAVVQDDDSEHMGVDLYALLATTVASLQEEADQVDALEARLQELAEQVARLSA